jgi:hypothetical protein
LQHLAGIYPQLTQIGDMAGGIGKPRGAVGEAVKNLEGRTPPLVSRPKGERSGVGITIDGFKALRPEDRPTRLQPRG